MTLNGWLRILLFLAVVLAVTKPLGLFMARVFEGERTFLHPLLRPVERLIYRLTGVDEAREMRWTEYAAAMLLFSLVSMLLLYAVQRLQGLLPLNPQGLPGVDSSASGTGFVASAFNTAASFTTNTNWQSYVPETTMSYLTQMAGLAYHNFASAAVGIALAVAFVRGVARRESDTIGNFWVDFVRCKLYVLLPLCFVFALALVSQGVVQNLRPYETARLVDPQAVEGVASVDESAITGGSAPVIREAMFSGVAALSVLDALNVMGLRTPQSAILSAVIFNALVIIALIPLALKGVKYKPMSAASLLRRNLLIYGLGGIVAPFVGIKVIDVIVHAIGLA